MATFTMELKKVLEYDQNIGLDFYPIFNEGYRDALNQKIIDHFWNREIGQETPEMFRLALRRKMNEIMPLYNQHYVTSQITFDPLETINISNLSTSTGTVVNTGTSATTSSSDAKSRAVSAEHPQEHLSQTGDYATASQDNVSNTGATGSSDETSNTDQNASGNTATTGFQGNAAEVIFRLRQTFVNIDMMVINELETLFMLVWSNGDEFTERNSYNGYYPNRFPF